ncbi:MAG: aminotransferase class III-fold pyridoxal phosphate-dependent enzyme [Candidatus Thorarchaeota archaeon]|jgi:4-aminobutyrate aminotransferase-like enzyme/Ser/Thr protein kinase RdoA (MazF antagonist)
MFKRDANRPKFTDDEARKITESKFGVKGSVKELPSERDLNFHIRSELGDEYVLKIAATSEKREILDMQNRAMQHLSDKLVTFNAPTFVLSKDAEEILTIKDSKKKEHFVRLLRYLPGRVFAEVKPHSPGLLTEFGKLIGSLTSGLEGFSHPSAKRMFYWDLKLASSVIEKYKEYVKDSEKAEAIEYVMSIYDTQVTPRMPDLRTSVVHNDANDYNVLVSNPYPPEEARFGILDFGDMVLTHTINELAVAIAYAILDKPDPVGAASKIVGGFHSKYPLTEIEIELLFPLVLARLATSIAVAEYQTQLEPDNQYLLISQKKVWSLLERLMDIHPRFAAYAFRQACGLPPCPQSEKIVEWLKENANDIGPIIEFDIQKAPFTIVDLSVGSFEIENTSVLVDIDRFSAIMSRGISDGGARYGIARYNEARLIYAGDQYRGPAGESRTVHIATDLILESGTQILAPLSGKVHSLKNNDLPLDNGPTVILEHTAGATGLKFYTLYAHLTTDSLTDLIVGDEVRKGQKIANVGTYPSNGGWPPHLHFQLIVDMLGREGDFFGVAPASMREVWLSISPDPNAILQLPEDRIPVSMSTREVLEARSRLTGKSLRTVYKEPIHIVRGEMQYLYDANGKQYLDGRNNVPHVGHSNPRVVAAMKQQATILNTNTTYLHENLVKYAERLCDKMPGPLSVCFFVNSGSEANELALRLAFAHTKQTELIVIDGAYHGNTGTLVGISPYKFDGPGGEGAPQHVHKVKTPDVYRGLFKSDNPEAGEKYAMDVLKVILDLQGEEKGIAAFICEPLMGCAGQIIPPENYLRDAFGYVRDAGGVCIVDEVQVGFGRVGSHFWGFETQGVVPDIVTLGKPIGNGHPLGAVITTPEIAESFNTGMEFFSTTGGNTVSCAVGMAVLDAIEEEDLQKNAHEIGSFLIDQLYILKKKHQIIGDVRGLGLFIGVELVLNHEILTPATEQASYVVNRMKDRGILISTDGPFDNVLKIKPPLVFTRENADFFVKTLDRVLAEDFVRFATSG